MKKDDGNLRVFMKGAPERILNRCSKILVNGEQIDFTEELRAKVNKANSDFGKLGERVLACAFADMPADKYSKESYQFDVKTWKNWGLAVPKRAILKMNTFGNSRL